MSECHYVVCIRCRSTERRSPSTLVGRSLARNRTGEFVIRALRPGGCRVCGSNEVEVKWGVPGSEVLPWRPREVRPRATGARELGVRDKGARAVGDTSARRWVEAPLRSAPGATRHGAY